MALLEVENLKVSFETPSGPFAAVDGVFLRVQPGETLAIVGQSGCGKTVLCRNLMRLCAGGSRPEGSIRLEGQELLGLSEKEMRQIRGKKMAYLFQEPHLALSPSFPIGAQIAEAILVHEKVGKREARERALRLLELVRLEERCYFAYPHQLSGGMLQRAALCVALACRPKLLIADEPTTALDATVQAEILQLLARLKRELGMAMLLITHDFGVAAQLADTIAVMRAGKFVEQGRAEEVLYTPAHPYTWSLLAALPGAGSLPQKGAAKPGQTARSGPRGDCAASLAGAPLERVSDHWAQPSAIEPPGRAQASLEHGSAPSLAPGQESPAPNRTPLTAHAAQRPQNAAQLFQNASGGPSGPASNVPNASGELPDSAGAVLNVLGEWSGRAQASLEHSPAPGTAPGQEDTLPNHIPLTARAAQKSQNAAQFFPSAPEEPSGPASNVPNASGELLGSARIAPSMPGERPSSARTAQRAPGEPSSTARTAQSVPEELLGSARVAPNVPGEPPSPASVAPNVSGEKQSAPEDAAPSSFLAGHGYLAFPADVAPPEKSASHSFCKRTAARPNKIFVQNASAGAAPPQNERKNQPKPAQAQAEASASAPGCPAPRFYFSKTHWAAIRQPQRPPVYVREGKVVVEEGYFESADSHI